MHPHAQALVDLTRQFLRGELTADAFDRSYRKLFSATPMAVDGDTFATLEELAFACSDYVDDPELRDEPDDLDEEGLRTAAQAALSALGVDR